MLNFFIYQQTERLKNNGRICIPTLVHVFSERNVG